MFLNSSNSRTPRRIIVYETGAPHEGHPWVEEEAHCDHCGNEWVAVHPCIEYLQCMICRKLSPSIADISTLAED